MRLSSPNLKSSGVICFPCPLIFCSSSGCRASIQSNIGSSVSSGITQLYSWLKIALALMKSSNPRSRHAMVRFGISGLRIFVKASRILLISRLSAYSNSLISLLVSKISAGSMYTVCPVADSSWMKPRSSRLSAARTGITGRPSRMVISAVLSVQPEFFASTRILCILWSMELCLRLMSRRISASSAEALSGISPLSSMRRFISVKI